MLEIVVSEVTKLITIYYILAGAEIKWEINEKNIGSNELKICIHTKT